MIIKLGSNRINYKHINNKKMYKILMILNNINSNNSLVIVQNLYLKLTMMNSLKFEFIFN